jgi:hypothetical protein
MDEQQTPTRVPQVRGQLAQPRSTQRANSRPSLAAKMTQGMSRWQTGSRQTPSYRLSAAFLIVC